MSRTASVATASTSRPGSLPPTGRTPAHPYSLYTQNVAAESNDGEHTNPVPVGFLGRGQHFHRQIGPEGEEQDIVGPDGHAEQLPPYSRYPEDTNHKSIAEGALESIGEADSPNNNNSNQPQSEMLERDVPLLGLQPPETARLNPVPVTGPDSDSGGQSDRSWNEKSWKEKRKTKIFGLPAWLCILLIVLLVIISAVLGGALGAHIGRGSGGDNDDYAPTSTIKPSKTPQEDNWTMGGCAQQILGSF